jgi:cytochrome c oxidase accessory protein FixG
MLGFAAKRQWVYAQAIKGRFQWWHRLASFFLHLWLFVGPWLVVGGHPLMRVDLPARRVYAFGAIFTASDAILLLLILLFLAFALFFFTSLWGRLWCGYACPQTVFLEEWIRPLERWIEGDRNARMRRDSGPWTFDRLWRKTAKWALFLAAAFVISMAMVSFFAGAKELWTGQAGPSEYALVGIFTGALFLDFAWFREQFCNYLCPYARFQSALIDNDTLQISYDPARGEPRGGALAKTEGRCVDCDLCVVVCPQGIDIRNGFQLECIACARCIDACEHVMGKLGHPSLVEYTTLAAEPGRKARLLRPRTVVYGGILTGLTAATIAVVAGRTSFEATVNRAPGSLYTLDADGSVRNTYFLRVTNNDPRNETVPFRVRVEGLEDAQVLTDEIRLGSTEERTFPLVIRIPESEHHGRTIPIEVHVSSPREERVLHTTFKTADELARAEDE